MVTGYRGYWQISPIKFPTKCISQSDRILKTDRKPPFVNLFMEPPTCIFWLSRSFLIHSSPTLLSLLCCFSHCRHSSYCLSFPHSDPHLTRSHNTPQTHQPFNLLSHSTVSKQLHKSVVTTIILWQLYKSACYSWHLQSKTGWILLKECTLKLSVAAGQVTNRIYTVRQKKRTNFLLCASLLILDKLVSFFVYIKERISYNSVYLILACVSNFA